MPCMLQNLDSDSYPVLHANALWCTDAHTGEPYKPPVSLHLLNLLRNISETRYAILRSRRPTLLQARLFIMFTTPPTPHPPKRQQKQIKAHNLYNAKADSPLVLDTNLFTTPRIDSRRHACRASVKLFELGVRTPGGLFLGVWYARSIDFRRFSYKPSDCRRNFWPTRSDEDV